LIRCWPIKIQEETGQQEEEEEEEVSLNKDMGVAANKRLGSIR
jgi:hypothetical protein